MKLVIFIGHFKTGSTSIQSFLSSNYLALLEAGILYPSVESQGLSRNLAVVRAGRDQSTAGDGLNIIEPHNALALRLKNEEDGHGVPSYYPAAPSGFQMMQFLHNQIEELKPNSVILCSEVFALLGMTPQRAGVERLARRFAQYDVTIYCNLRRPDEYLSSWHRQRLKFGAKLLPLSGEGLQEYLDSAHFQQAKMIEGWIKDHFPKARLIVRNFAEVKASGGSVVDFMRNAGIVFPANLQIPKDQNPSVPSAFAEIGRRSILELNAALSKEIVQWLVTARRRVRHPGDSEVEMYGAKNRAVMATRFAEVAASLDRLTGRNPFYPDLRDIGVSRALDDLTAAEVVLPDLVADARHRGLDPSAIDWLATLDLRK
ncbi:hypothetical protein [Paracoccus aerius]|uniref:Sulfotransferase family protein n=1 Tax=Paracoccus aerius TaxID=1915382 RepID=A0ABS1SDD5_9RHOB|nr:hypothetical protein [Paracoccus aerius]MBL3675506.1 hypothetical protein [Paracoccus aerius]